MTLTYNSTLKGTRMQAVLDAVDAGTPPGSLEIMHSNGTTVLATFTLPNPSFVRTGAVLALNGAITDTSADATGTATTARIKNAAGTIVIDGITCGVGTGDIQFNSTSITSGQQVTISTGGTITHG